jgi:hypothetical protein
MLVGLAQESERWTGLPEREYRTLCRMALRALDGPSRGRRERLYWAGEDDIARTWRTYPRGSAPADRRARQLMYREVRRIWRVLEAEKAIELVTGNDRPGDVPEDRQVYRILI